MSYFVQRGLMRPNGTLIVPRLNSNQLTQLLSCTCVTTTGKRTQLKSLQHSYRKCLCLPYSILPSHPPFGSRLRASQRSWFSLATISVPSKGKGSRSCSVWTRPTAPEAGRPRTRYTATSRRCSCRLARRRGTRGWSLFRLQRRLWWSRLHARALACCWVGWAGR